LKPEKAHLIGGVSQHILFFMEPIQPFCLASGDGGTMSAMGLPNRVSRGVFGLAHLFEQDKALGLKFGPARS
jgi:hypothetical protein